MSVQFQPSSSNLPHYLTRFIGREREIRQLTQLLNGGQETRLITLTGVGGCGKTRLAVEAALAFSNPGAIERGGPVCDGVHWVDLTPLSEPALVPHAVAAALELREATGRSPMAALLTALKPAHMLLVLDNCDRLTGACAVLAQRLLAACPYMLILATSRTPLNVAEESVFPVPHLGVDDTGARAAGVSRVQSEAVQLFLDRAAMMLSGYTIRSANVQTLNQICQRLDGLPLAIELAASWIRVLSAQDILAQVEKSLDFLASTAPLVAPRHRSIRAVLDQSWRGLTAEQQQVFTALAVFRGSFSREAAEAVAAASLPSLAALVENSLIQRLPGGEGSTRYQLHEVVRQYAQDRLEASTPGRGEQMRQRHLSFYLGLAEAAAEAWDSANEAASLNKLRLEQANLRTAMRHAIANARAEEALRLSAALFTFWIYSTPPGEYNELLQRSLDLPWEDRSAVVTMARAKACNVAGYAGVAASEFSWALSCFQEGLALYTRLDDERGISWSLRGCGFATLLVGDAERAQPYVEQSLALCRRSDDRWGEAWSIFDLGHIAFARGILERAQPLLVDALRRFRQLGIVFGAYRALILLGDVERRHSCWAEAVAYYGEALQLEKDNRFGQFGADLLEGLAKIAAVQRQPNSAASLFGAGHAWRQTFGQARAFFYEPGYRQILEVAQAQLARSDWSRAYAAGYDLNSDQAMAEARQVARELASLSFAPYPVGLTEREVEVLSLLAKGLKDQEIAAQLVVSPRTIHAHLRSIYGKLGVGTRTAAAHEAAKLNLT